MTAEQIFNALKERKWMIDVQYCHPENPNEKIIEQAKRTAWNYLQDITIYDVEGYFNDFYLESDFDATQSDDAKIASFLTTIADMNKDEEVSKYETITPCFTFIDN